MSKLGIEELERGRERKRNIKMKNGLNVVKKKQTRQVNEQRERERESEKKKNLKNDSHTIVGGNKIEV